MVKSAYHVVRRFFFFRKGSFLHLMGIGKHLLKLEITTLALDYISFPLFRHFLLADDLMARLYLLFLLFRNNMMTTTIFHKNVLVTFIHLHKVSWFRVSTFNIYKKSTILLCTLSLFYFTL